MTKSVQEMIHEFHHTFGCPVHDVPRDMSVSERELRLKLLAEEFAELIAACGFEPALPIAPIHIKGSKQDIVEMADGLGDLVVLCYGMALHMGIDLDAVVAEIHESNMSKLDANGQPIINGCVACGSYTRCGCESRDAATLDDPSQPIGKILKGPNYRRPDIAKVVFF